MGLLDMRTAKAEYIRALKDLRAADAEYTRAKAAVEQANARYRDAETAFKNAQVENQKLLNDLQELWNEAQAQENTRRAAEIAAEIEGIEMKMEELAAAHAVQMVQYEAQLAQAQEGLRVVLRDIAIASKSLSPNEKLAVIESAALVAVLSEAQVKALKDVNEAQYYLDSLTFKALVNGSTWEDGFLEGLEEHYQDLIEVEQAKIAIAEVAKALVPVVTAQLDEWQAIVDGYTEDSLAIAQEMAQQTYDSTAYINATVKPGIVKFNKAIAEFIEENWETPDMGNTSYKYAEPALTPTEKTWAAKTKAPAKTDAEYNPTEGGPAAQLSVFPVLTDLENDVWFNKYAYILTGASSKNYSQENYLSSETAKPAFMQVKARADASKPDTLKINGPLNKDMKDFIVGTIDMNSNNAIQYPYTGTPKVTVSYGIRGAYAVMERVYSEMTAKYRDSAAFFAKKKKDADSVWNAQNEILTNGLAAYDKYVKAIDEFVEAASIDNNGQAKMKAAIDEFVKQWNIVAGHAEWDYHDSLAIMTAIQDFAKAREEYLDWNADTLANHGWPKGSKNNQLYVPYVVAADPLTVDTIAIKDLDLTEIQKTATINKIKGSKYEFVVNGDTVSTVTRLWNNNHASNPTDFGVFGYIVTRMMGGAMANLVTNVPTVAITDTAAVFNSAWAYSTGYPTTNTALLGGWKYANGKVVLASGENYITKAVKEKEDAVLAAVKDYVDIYNDYWGRDAKGDSSAVKTAYQNYFDAVLAGNANTTKATAEAAVAGLFNQKLMDKQKGTLLATSYTKDDFKPYGDEKPFVAFTPASITSPVDATIDSTNALMAVLAVKDPFTAGTGDHEQFNGADKIKASAIFYGGSTSDLAGVTTKDPKQTSLFRALFWEYLDYMANHEPEIKQDLARIDEWIKAVVKVFDDNNAKQAAPKYHPEWFERDSTLYADAKARKVVVDAYMVKKLAFVGTRTEQIGGKDSVVLNDLFIKNNPIDTIAEGVSYTLTKDADPFASLFATNLFGEYVGWTDKLAGKQLANAKEFFGEKPYEQIQEWKVARKVNEAKQATLSSLKEKAEAVFVEKAKVEGIGAVDSTSLKTMKAYWKNYVDEIDGEIKVAKEAIAGYDDEEGQHHKGYAENLADAIAGSIDSEYLIKDAEIKLAAAEARLADITKMLEKAQSNLDKIMEYIRSTDAEFVIPVTLEEIDALIKNIDDNIDLAAQIQALIAAYMGGAEEEPVEEGEGA